MLLHLVTIAACFNNNSAVPIVPGNAGLLQCSAARDAGLALVTCELVTKHTNKLVTDDRVREILEWDIQNAFKSKALLSVGIPVCFYCSMIMKPTDVSSM